MMYEIKENYNVNIPEDSFNRLKEDMKIFNQKKINSFLNKIFKTYLKTKDKDDLTEVLIEKLSKYINKENREDILSILKSTIYKPTNLKSNKNKKKLNFRINKDIKFEFEKLKKEQNYFNANFFRIIIEWYIQKPKFQREKIIFYEELEIIEKSIVDESEVLLEIINLKKDFFRPVGIFSTKNENYNHILIVKINVETKKEELISIRLSEIVSIKKIEKNYRISKKTQEIIKEKIENKNFTTTKIERVKIKMTEEGYKLYKKISHIRPDIKEEKKEQNFHILTFEVPTDIIIFYFLRFGKEIEILEPKNLREEFKTFYKTSLDNYI